MENLTDNLSEKDATLVKMDAMLRNAKTLHKKLNMEMMKALDVATPSCLTNLLRRKSKLTNAKRLAVEEVLQKYESFNLAE